MMGNRLLSWAAQALCPQHPKRVTGLLHGLLPFIVVHLCLRFPLERPDPETVSWEGNGAFQSLSALFRRKGTMLPNPYAINRQPLGSAHGF